VSHQRHRMSTPWHGVTSSPELPVAISTRLRSCPHAQELVVPITSGGLLLRECPTHVRGLGRESYPRVFPMMFVRTSDRSFSTVLIRLPPLTRLLFRTGRSFLLARAPEAFLLVFFDFMVWSSFAADNRIDRATRDSSVFRGVAL